MSFKRVERAAEKVRDRLLRTCRALEGAGVPFAVIGGNAVAVWVESIDEGAGRNTKDVDIAISRSDIQRAAAAMSVAGFDLEDVGGITVFLDRADPSPSRGVHVVFIGEKIRPSYKYPVPAATHVKRSEEGVPVINLDELLVMKLQSNRARDHAHIIDLYEVGLITESVIQRVPTDLQQRLREIIASEPQ